MTRYLRTAAGIAVLAALALFAALMLPPYFRNLEFQRYIENLAANTGVNNAPGEMVRVNVLNKAAQMGLPVRHDQVRVEPAGERYLVEVRYFVRVDLPLYTVDLHFRPSAGR